MTELQKDPITRGDFLGFGVLGTIMGAILGIPSVAFVLGPVINKDVLGQSDVDEGWQEVGSVSEVPKEEPKVFEVEFPLTQSYGDKEIQKKSGVSEDKQFTIRNAVWVSWKKEIVRPGRQGSSADELGDTRRPAFMDEKSEGFSEQEREEIKKNLNVLSNSCAHLGCPVRWVTVEGHGEFLCPCHGGIYDVNGGWAGGPPPRGMYRYTKVDVRENGRLYIKHEYDVKPGIPGMSTQEPYVV